MSHDTITYNLNIEDVRIDKDDNGKDRVTVTYVGKDGRDEQSSELASEEMPDVLACCQEIARAIFRSEFRLNAAVDLRFELLDDKGISIWHTKPNMFLKVPLKMDMHWSCSHLRENYKSFTTLGMVQAPEELQLDGSSLGTLELTRLLMDSMATGVEFMGNIMYMRDTVDHDTKAAEAT